MNDRVRVGKAVLLLAGAMLCGSSVLAWAPPAKSGKPQDVTLTGKLVDLHCYMTEKFASPDKVKCTRDCLQAGIPAALETKDGIVLIGAGAKGEHRTKLLPLAYENVELKGKLYEKHGVKFVDLESINQVKATPAPGAGARVRPGEPQEDEDEDADDDEEEEDEE